MKTEERLTEKETIDIIRDEFGDLFDIDYYVNQHINEKRQLVYNLDAFIIRFIIFERECKKDPSIWLEYLYGKNMTDIIFLTLTPQERNASIVNYLRENRKFVEFQLL